MAVLIFMESGYLLGDHTEVRNAIAHCCRFAFDMWANWNGCYLSKILVIHCVNAFRFQNHGVIFVSNLETEEYNAVKWYQQSYTLLDPGNAAMGRICYNTRAVDGYPDPSIFTKSGGANIQCIPTFRAAVSFTVAGARDESEGALKDLIAKLVAQGIIVDSTTAS